MDKVGRLGVRVQDILDESILRQKVEGALRQKNELLVKVYNRRHVEVNEIVDYFLSFAERLKPMIVDTTQLLNNALDEGKTLLMEGGQATFLDVDLGCWSHPHFPCDRYSEGVHHPCGCWPVPH